MKKLFTYLAVFGMLSFGTSAVMAQEEGSAEATQTEQVTEQVAPVATSEVAAPTQAEPVGVHKAIKIKFVEGGVPWMAPILLCLIIGLAIVIERVIYLHLSTTNTKKLLTNVERALNEGGVEAAKDVCRQTRGPVASIFYQGFDRFDEGVDVVEKSVVSYGSVQMGLMEKGLTWISLFIALSPMLGFMGTVVGMIQAFDQIQAMGDISPTAVAGGIKVALLTTVFGLIAAVILQIFYNYLVSKIDGIVNSMEDASISLLDIIVKYKVKH